MVIFLLTTCLKYQTFSQSVNVYDFTSLYPDNQKPQFSIPSTHSFQAIAQKNDTLSDSSLLKGFSNFAMYVPDSGSSKKGKIVVNHTTANEGTTVFNLELLPVGIKYLWQNTHTYTINYNVLQGTTQLAGGGISPWGRVIVSEKESTLSPDNNSDGYYDTGWFVELDTTVQYPIRKLFALGRAPHENIAFKQDKKTCYFGADDGLNGYLYKFVADSTEKLNSGKLYVLKLTGLPHTASVGTWELLNNTAPYQCNAIGSAAQAANATNFNEVGSVAISPLDNKIYFTSKSSGRIFRFRDNGDAVDQFSIFVESASYPITHSTGTENALWGVGHEHIAFDNAGNLWVMQNAGKYYLWVVEPNHLLLSPKIKLFGICPTGGKLKGLSFSPDNRFLFLTIHEPGSSNNANQIDEANKTIDFNRSTVLVIGRKEAFLPTHIANMSMVSNAIQVYPNPGQEIIHLSGLENVPHLQEIYIIDTQGKIVHKYQNPLPKMGTYTIPIKNLHAGLYRIVLQGQTIVSKSFIKI